MFNEQKMQTKHLILEDAHQQSHITVIMSAANEAWLTSATEDGAVDKALVLAASLRRVRTARKLIVLTTLSVSVELRRKLKHAFDSVLLMDQKWPKHWNLEDYARTYALSLMMFGKYVYLSPNMLVLKNCDEIFGKHSTFAASYASTKHDMIDTSVFLFTPSLEYDGVIGEPVLFGGFQERFSAFIENSIPNMETLDDQYNVTLKLKGKDHQRLATKESSIFNFIDVHPLDTPVDSVKNTSEELGHVERFAVEACWNIYLEDVKPTKMHSKCDLLKNFNKSESIAIVGMSFRLPGGNNVDEFWSTLAEGKNAVIQLPSHRWTKEHSYRPCYNRNVEAGFLNIPIDEFDAKFFGLSPKEAEFLDPQQRLLMEVTWEAMEDAMIDPLKLNGTQTGVFVGTWVHDYKDMLSNSVDPDFFRTYMGNSIGSSASRLSHFFGTTGPSVGTESGCSAAIAAIDMACKSLRNGVSNMAIAAGANLLLHPFESTMMEYVLSPDFRCKTFDASANGFVRAEGCAVLILKRLSDALSEHDHIWGLIRGSALTQEGVSKSLGTPTVQCESLAMELALKDAGVDPKDVSYIEAHGTGTSVGDPMEILAIEKTYSKGRANPLIIGSVKANVGHTESVSGITGIIKVLLSMKNEMIPKHLNLETLNPMINLDAIPAQIPLEPMPWPRTEGKQRIAGVSSFGISGTDGHAIIEEPLQVFHPQLVLDQKRPLHIMKISAKCSESLNDLLQNYLDIFNEKMESNEDFANIAYSANIGRATHNHRATIIAKNFSEAANQIKEKLFSQSEIQSVGSSLCFLFTGQGSQYPKMAKQLYETSPLFKDCFDKCDDFLREKYNISLKGVLWSDSGNHDELNRTLYSQTSIFVVEYCLLQLWESWGIKPDYVMGHSLGEFAAAVGAGALSLEDALLLVAERSKLIDNLPQGKMLVIRTDKKTVDDMILKFQKMNPQFWVDYAAINSLDQTVVAGDSEMIQEFSRFCGEKSLTTINLAATHAFHSRHMNPMLDEYRRVAETVEKPRFSSDLPKFISGMEGRLVDVNSINADYWVRHTREPVKYIEACKALQQNGCALFLEIGPHPVLSALTMMNYEGHSVTCLPSIRRKEDEWKTMLESVSKLYLSPWKGEIDWKGFDGFYERKKVKLPFYPFNRKPVWAHVGSACPKVHPLLGSILPTASNETIFQNSLTLKNTPFAQEHVIGNTAVFPGAGFLEMCLAGGHSTVQGICEKVTKPKRPIQLKSLKISSPLALFESEICKVQTLVTLMKDEDFELGYSVTVNRNADTDNGTGKWIEHVSAKFLPIAPNLHGSIPKPLDIQGIQSTWTKSDNREFYEKLGDVGLRFGPKFQSLETCWNSEEGALAAVKVPQDYHDYLIHPVIGDAMIQSYMLWTSRDKIKKKLQVPVQIGEFIWLQGTESPNQFVFCSTDEHNSVYCVLVDETGSPLAYMRDIECVETTVKLVEGMIAQQSNGMPNLWEEVWKPSRGPMQGYLTHETRLEDLDYSPEELKYFEQINNLPEEELEFYKNLVYLSRLSVLKALYDLGWEPNKLKEFSAESLIQNLKIMENFTEYINFFLHSMAKQECGVLQFLENGKFQFLEKPPTKREIEEGLKYVPNSKSLIREQYRMTMEVSKRLSKVFIGEVDPLTIIFPDDSRKPNAAKFYEDAKVLQTSYPAECKARLHAQNAETHYLSCTNASKCRPVYRILEVGAGTGSFTKDYINKVLPMACKNSDVEYYFTDVSYAFFLSAEKNFEEYLNSLVFMKYDMEEDPLEQGFCPGFFDVIVAAEVLHVAKDIRKAIKSIRSLLKPGGLIMISETVYPDERLTFSFGLLPGYWNFADRDFRKYHATMTPEMWNKALSEAGFHGINIIPMYANIHGAITAYAYPQLENDFLLDLRPKVNSWIIFGEQNEFCEGLQKKILNVNRNCLIFSQPMTEFTEANLEKYYQNAVSCAKMGSKDINIEGILFLWPLFSTNRNQESLSLPFVTLMKLVSALQPVPKTFVVIKGASVMESSEVVDPTPGTVIGFCRSLTNENLDLRNTYFDLDPNESTLEQLDELFMNLWVEHKQAGAAFRDGLRLYPKLSASKVLLNEPLSLPSGCERFQLVLPKSRLISDLEFTYLDPYKTIEDDEVEVEVKAMALNFRDVFAVLKPIPLFEKVNSVGLDFTGVVVKTGRKVTSVKIGDRVMGTVMDENISLPSHYKLREGSIILLPDTMTFAEGVTLPAVVSTALYCLITVGDIKKGETVLIHTASGGVGLAAIQICKHVGANIIATAGYPRKRKYLRNLGIEHVFHSRTTDFKEQILDATGGRGVDIVLNSITGPGFKEASLDVLGPNGRFIEMSKLNVWSKEEVERLRPDVTYHLVDLTSLEANDQNKLTRKLRDYIYKGYVRPIPYERFDALNIRGALDYLQKAKHIGKIVCIMPEIKLEKSRLIVTTPLFNPDSTYVVTGGLGGIGFAVVKWMLANRAKYIAIFGRSACPKPEFAAQIESWNRDGKHVMAFSVDVGNYEMLKSLFDELRKPELGFPPVRGVMHVAGVLQDAILDNQTWDTFLQAYNAKVDGSWNLHDLTKDYLLEHFVLFSSIAAAFGAPGQSNHSASNAFQDSLAAYRRCNGLPATSVNWGNWGEVGVATELDAPGFRPISTSQGLLALQTFLKTPTKQMCVFNVDSFALALKIFPQLKYYLDDCRLLGDAAKTVIIINRDEFWNEVDSAPGRERKVECFKKLIQTVVRNILKMDGNEPIDDQTEFATIGIDSLMMLEMKNGMQNILGGRMTLTVNQLNDCNTIKVLANTLVDILEGEHDDDVNLPNMEELKELIKHDSNLLPETLSTKNLQGPSIDQVEIVLLTGATGNLGPYILSELTKKAQIKKVICLIRSTVKKNGFERLKARVEQLNIAEKIDFNKVEVVDGDIACPKFDLKDELYFELCERVDAVIHSAVKADHTAKYWKASETRKSHVRTVNVFGTIRLLEFAAERRLKHFFHASTIVAFMGMGKNGEYSEGWQSVHAMDDFELARTSGYVITKHIAEQLVYQALHKGIPCKAFRFPHIAGDSKTGRVDYQHNHLMLRWLACMKVGAIHDIPIPFISIPVDCCAKISLDIFFNPKAPLDVYNVVQRQVEPEQVLVQVAQQFGIHLEIVSYDVFVQTLKDEDENSPVAPFVKFYVDNELKWATNFTNPSNQALIKYFNDSQSFLNASKILEYAPEFDHYCENVSQVMIRDLTFLKSRGVFEKYDIKVAS